MHLVAAILGAVLALVPTPAEAAGFENPIFDFMRPGLAPEIAQEQSTPPEVQSPAPSPEPLPAPRPARPARRVSSTAYCLTGTMANGQRAHDGAVAMNGVRFGTRFEVLSGPWAGRILTVKDRIGWGSAFDVAMPGNCAAARQYGRRSITIRRV